MAFQGLKLHSGFLLFCVLRLALILQSCTALATNGTSGALDTAENRNGGTISQGVLRFGGHEDEADYFQLLYTEGKDLLLGARNVIYNLSAVTLQENQRISWDAEARAKTICIARSKSKEQCQNYIKLIMRTGPSTMTICGTNAFKPLCRQYRYQKDGTYFHMPSTPDKDDNGAGYIPSDPTHNGTAVIADGRLFTATTMNSIVDAFIYSHPMMTARKHSEVLNSPNFVSSMEYDDKVYFFFREVAVEHINCGKAVFSRVARICKNDEGGARQVFKDTFSSFFKARLNCSIPGEYPFYLDEIQSTSEIGQGNYMSSLISSNRSDMVYAVFNTPRNGISGSAVCAYRFSDIQESFEGAFKAKRNPTSIWLPVKEEEVPVPHPAKTCSNDSKQLSDSTLNFISEHPLMDQAVPAFGGQPIYFDVNSKYRLTQVAVDWQVRAADLRYYDVLFIGTDNGHVLKAVNKAHGSEMETIVIEDLEVFSSGSPVTNLKLIKNHGVLEKLIVVSRDEVVSLPLHRCEEKITCSSCMSLRDPYCTWHEGRCTNNGMGIQSVETGSHQQCRNNPLLEEDEKEKEDNRPVTTCPACPKCLPSDPQPTQVPEPDGTAVPVVHHTRSPTHHQQNNEIPNSAHNIAPCVGASTSDLYRSYSSQTMVLAVLLTMILSLLVGFALGFFFLRIRRCLQRLYHSNHGDDPDAFLDHKTAFEKTSSQAPDNRWDKNNSQTTSNNLNTTSSTSPHNTNIYQPAPSTCTDTGFMTAGRLLPGKQLNTIVNPLNASQSSGRQPNGQADTKIVSPKGKTYL